MNCCEFPLLFQDHGREDEPAGPSSATLSRARVKSDVFLMMARRVFWKYLSEGYTNRWTSLCRTDNLDGGCRVSLSCSLLAHEH